MRGDGTFDLLYEDGDSEERVARKIRPVVYDLVSGKRTLSLLVNV